MYNVLDPYQSVSLTVLGLFFFSAELHLNHSLQNFVKTTNIMRSCTYYQEFRLFFWEFLHFKTWTFIECSNGQCVSASSPPKPLHTEFY